MIATPAAKRRLRILDSIVAERKRQESLWGKQVKPLCEDPAYYQSLLSRFRKHYGDGEQSSWDAILFEEFLEAVSESDPLKAREELVQLAAVCVQIIERIDCGELAEFTEFEDLESISRWLESDPSTVK